MTDKQLQWRLNFAMDVVGRCERCGRGHDLQVHEITNAHARQESLTDPSCILVVCAYCHAWLHGKGQHGKLLSLAYLYHRRPGDYDLKRIHELRLDNWPDQKMVDVEIKRLVQGDNQPEGAKK